MNRYIHSSRLILVLINLVFVAITGVASATWLVPLFVLCLASPWLHRYAEHRIAKWAWNGLVVLAFAALIRHAIVAGPRHVLEDGLLLAALCQVHLLNNLTRIQRPDLLFFNAIIIAIVTSILCIELDYLLVFLAFVPALLMALQLHVAIPRETGSSGHAWEPNRSQLWTFLRRAVARSLVVLALTMTIFTVAPRDFARKGFLSEQIRIAGRNRTQVGFDEKIDLSRRGQALASDNVVLLANLEHGPINQFHEYWRGATLDHFDGQRWSRNRSLKDPVKSPWTRVGLGHWRRGKPAEGKIYRVRQLEGTAGRLMIPVHGTELRMLGAAMGLRGTLPQRDLTFVMSRSLKLPLDYVVTVAAPAAEVPPEAMPSNAYLSLPQDLPEALVKLRFELLGNRSSVTQPAQVAARLEQGLTARFAYRHPGEEGAATNLEEFLSGASSGGHCEYFATALALMLRQEGIPARVVTGYRSSEWDEESQTLTIRGRHAHAWVEAHVEGAWLTLDSTPPSLRDAANLGFFASLGQWITDLWRAVTTFDEISRDRAMEGAMRAGRAVLGFLRERGVWMLLGASGILAYRIQSRRRRTPAPIRNYARVLRRLRLAPEGGETPRELLVRAQSLSLKRGQWELLSAATALHEKERYGEAGSAVRRARERPAACVPTP